MLFLQLAVPCDCYPHLQNGKEKCGNGDGVVDSLLDVFWYRHVESDGQGEGAERLHQVDASDEACVVICILSVNELELPCLALVYQVSLDVTCDRSIRGERASLV
eukprot:TRINITY_DN15278_c0_g1_i5.p3 TRINITY_DN15278_c0_g1~~TRINITY_DN15278_c0_g1_i5.p3  ORF type:complete len:105 (+),score=5.23 TRINITY_DN15278_c0_g1_i5:509-823(+)